MSGRNDQKKVVGVNTLDHAKSVISSLRASSKAKQSLIDNDSNVPNSSSAVPETPRGGIAATPRRLDQSPPQHVEYVLGNVNEFDNIITTAKLGIELQKEESKAINYLVENNTLNRTVMKHCTASVEIDEEEEKKQILFELIAEQQLELLKVSNKAIGTSNIEEQRKQIERLNYDKDSDSDGDNVTPAPNSLIRKPNPTPSQVQGKDPSGNSSSSASVNTKSVTSGLGMVQQDISKYDAIMKSINNKANTSTSSVKSSNILFTYTDTGPGRKKAPDAEEVDDWNTSDPEDDPASIPGSRPVKHQRGDSPPLLDGMEESVLEEDEYSGSVKTKTFKSQVTAGMMPTEKKRPMPIIRNIPPNPANTSTNTSSNKSKSAGYPVKASIGRPPVLKSTMSNHDNWDDDEEDEMMHGAPYMDGNDIMLSYDDEGIVDTGAGKSKTSSRLGNSSMSNKKKSVNMNASTASISSNISVLTTNTAVTKSAKQSSSQAVGDTATSSRVMIKPGQAIKVRPSGNIKK